MSQVIPETRDFLLACHSCTSLVKGIINTEKKLDSLKNELHDIKRIGLLEILEQSCLVTNTLENYNSRESLCGDSSSSKSTPKRCKRNLLTELERTENDTPSKKLKLEIENLKQNAVSTPGSPSLTVSYCITFNFLINTN